MLKYPGQITQKWCALPTLHAKMSSDNLFHRISTRKVTFRRDICAYSQAVAVCSMSKRKLSDGPWAVFRGKKRPIYTKIAPNFWPIEFRLAPIRYGTLFLFSLHCSQRFHSKSPDIYFSCPLLLRNTTFSLSPFAFFQGWDQIQGWQARPCDQRIRCLRTCGTAFNSPWTHQFPVTVQSRPVCFCIGAANSAATVFVRT